MKKFLVALLFFFFANSIVAPVFADSNVKKIVKLKVDSSTEKSLGRAGKAFEDEYLKFCKDFKDKNLELCKDGFSQKYPNSSKIKTVEYNAEKPEEFFNLVVEFYKELQEFAASKDSELTKLNEQAKNDIQDLLKTIAEKRNELVEKLNNERKILNELNLSDGYKSIDDATEDNLKAPNSDLKKYAAKIDKKTYPDDKIIVHVERNLSSKSSDLSKKSDEDLDKWQKRLMEIDKSIDTEIAKTEKNIAALKNIKKKQEDDKKNERQKTLDAAWDALEKALEEEKKAFKNYDNKSVADYKKTEKEFDLTNMENAINKAKNGGDKLPLEDHEPKISKPSLDAENFDKLVENLKKQTTIANNNAEKLNNAKKGKDEKELDDLKNKLLEEKQKEAGLLKSINGDEISVSAFDKAVDELNNSLAKTTVKNKNGKVILKDEKGKEKSFEEQKKILTDEINNVRKINEQLEKINKNKTDEFENCKKELASLIAPDALGTLQNPKVDSLENCKIQLDAKKKEQNKQLEEIENNFIELYLLVKKIDLLEKTIYTTKNRMTDKNVTKDGFDYKMLGYSDSKNEIGCLDDIGGVGYCKGKKLVSLDWNVVANSENIDIGNAELKNWNDYFVKVIAQAEQNVNNMKAYVDSEKNKCDYSGYWDGSWKNLSSEIKKKVKNLSDEEKKKYKSIISASISGQAGDGTNLQDELDMCYKFKEVAECRKYRKAPYDIPDYKPYENNYGSVDDVRNVCYGQFKAECPVKDKYTWPKYNSTLQYTDMQNELDKCKSFGNEEICKTYVKSLVDKVNDGKNKQVDFNKFKYIGYPECQSADTNKKICEEYRDVNGLNKNIFGNNFDFKSGVSNCKTLVDSILDMLNNCPGLKGREASEFTSAEEINKACLKINSDNCISHQTEIINRMKLVIIPDFSKIDNTSERCYADADETACEQYKKIRFDGYENEPTLSLPQSADKLNDYRYVDECIKAVRGKIQNAVDICNNPKAIIERYDVKTENYISKRTVDEACAKAKESSMKDTKKSIKQTASEFICLANPDTDSRMEGLIKSIFDYCEKVGKSPVQYEGSGSCYINSRRYVAKDPFEVDASTKPESMQYVLSDVLSKIVKRKCGTSISIRDSDSICKNAKAYIKGCAK